MNVFSSTRMFYSNSYQDRVLIVAKTRMKCGTCVGGLLFNGQKVRLLDEYEHNQPVDTTLDIGDIYNITYTPRENCILPHTEDILVSDFIYESSYKSIKQLWFKLMNEFRVHHIQGNPEYLFDGKLRWTSAGSGYISKYNVPQNSVSFWIPDKNLVFDNETNRYIYDDNHSFKFVGLQGPVWQIPSGTLTRVSLARWWSHDGTVPERCYLQFSGWYRDLH